MSDRECLEIFEKYLAEEKRASGNTLSSYMRDIRQLGEYLGENGGHDIAEASDAELEAYIDFLRDEGKSVSTVSRCIASIKCLYTTLCIKRLIGKNPSLRLTPEKAERHTPDILSKDEVITLLSAPECIDLKGYRDKAMLEVLYATGLRVSELIDLNLSDADIVSGTLICRSRGKERVLPMYETAVDSLKEYIELIRPQMIADPEEEALFVNVSGERMSRQGFWKLLKYYAKKANIDKDITPHMLRHSFAVHLLENGADVKSIGQIMGHSDLSSMHVYDSLVSNSVRDAYNRAHPRARKE